MRNRTSAIGSSSKYKGVRWVDPKQRWRAEFQVDGKTRHIGHFTNEEDAARAYDAKTREVFGEYAYLNFPEEGGD